MRLTGVFAGLAVVLGLLGPAPAGAQGRQGEHFPEIDRDQPVSLVADDVSYDNAARRLTASGNVEVFYGARTLTAERIVYDALTERLRAEGDIVLRDDTGTTVFADMADLDPDLRDGLIRGAKAMLNRHTRLAAVEARRIEDRYNILSKATYSPCDVCEAEPTPLWRIRARRVIHDQQERMIHYEDARLEFFGVPVLWTPYFSHPDPTVDRKTGFLAPDFSSSSKYGLGITAPFYWVIDDHSDLTLTPFVMTDERPLGIVEYRRRFANGRLRFEGSLTQSDFAGSDEIHGNVSTQGDFDLGGGADWGWDINFASDDDYLRFYDFSDVDRLDSDLFIRGYREGGFFDIRAIRFQSLRPDEPAGQIPLVLPRIEARRDLGDPWLGGMFGATVSTQTLRRDNGRDTARLSVGLDWERTQVLPVGLAVEGFGSLRGDLFYDGGTAGTDDDLEGRIAPRAGVKLRLPLIGETDFADGRVLTHVIEPIAQAIVAPYGGNGPDIVNEDSLITEFDETNLFDRNHFSGIDGFEEGPRLDLGLRYALMQGGRLGFDGMVGRVLRLEDATEFGAGSGLRDAESDWIAAWSARYDPYVTVRHRFRLGSENLSITRNDFALDLAVDPVRLSANYIFLDSDPVALQPRDREEISGRLRLALTPEWSLNGFVRHDIERDEFVLLGGSVRFVNECCSLSAFVRRDFTDTETVEASTSFGVRVELMTLGGGGRSLEPDLPGVFGTLDDTGR